MKKDMNSRQEHATYTPPAWFNKAIIWMLRSPLHALVGKDMMLITVSGRKTGKQYTIPVSYARDGDLVICSADRSRGWWKNVRSGDTVTLQLDGTKRTDMLGLLNKLINPVMMFVLQSRFHSLFSKDLMLLTFTGRKSGLSLIACLQSKNN